MSEQTDIRMELMDYAGRKLEFRELSQKTKRLLSDQATGRCMEVLMEGANEIRNEIILSMRNTLRTSKLAGHGVGKLYSKGYKNKKGKLMMHRASVPGFPPAPDSGDLIRSIIVDARLTEVEVGSTITNPAYPRWLEDGTKRMKARPWLAPAAAKWEPRIKMAMRRVLRETAEEYSR
jgi:hypothetical protein